ncbi:MAG: NAD-dependent deacylase [Planctomycetes bacterium]|nr:NAD-dependent deacylase [Planctomycetota bacterium]
MHDSGLLRAADMLRSARSVVVLTGAGVSAESGVPTFRDPEEGLWAKYDPMELATIGAFERDPELVTRWYHWRFERCSHCKPNPAHTALALMQQRIETHGGAFALLTQNIDGLHQRAGSTGVVELHGTILTWRCTKTGRHTPMADIDFTSYPVRSEAGGLLRPNVVWFGEMLAPEAVDAAERAVGSCDLFLSVGTSAVVYPAAGYIEQARSIGASTIEVNRDPTPVTAAVDLSLQGLAGEILPQMVQRAFES